MRAVGAIECEKVMSRHVYWHSAGIHRDEWEDYWSKDVKITWGHGWGRQDDRYSYYFSYVLEKERNAFKTFMGIKLKYPDVENCTRLDGVAEYSNHLTTSPVIEVADDAMSAKGLWYTPGFALRHDYVKGTADVAWMWEKYGGDFVYENGEWRFLRLLICMDMSTGEPNSWTEPRPPMGPPPEEEEFDPDDPDGKRGKSPAMGGGVSVEKDEPGRFTDYKPTRIPTETPKLPEPFESLDKTWSY
jgi:hypothetical protein